MFTHLRIGTNDIEKSRSFYDQSLGALGIRPATDMNGMLAYEQDGNRLMVGKPIEGAATHANGGTIGFKSDSTEAVDKFHAAGLAAGGTDEGAPGPRGGGQMYGAYLRDPDGNKICAIKIG